MVCPDIAVVIPAPPAIFKSFPPPIITPVESSPTKLIPVPTNESA